MRYIHQAWTVALYDFRTWRRNPRVFISFALAFILCYLLSAKVTAFTEQYDTTLQVLEPFIWTFSDSTSVLLSSLLLVFLFADMPFVTTGTPFFLMRTDRRVWLIGQGVYIVTGTVIYMLFILASTTFICAANAFPGNMWSSTAAMLGYSGAGSAIAVPATIKQMETSTPYECAGIILLLMTGYALVMMAFMLVFNLLRGQRAGMAAVFGLSLFGILLDPDLFATVLRLPEDTYYKANVIVGWLSPLSHATFPRHNFGYDLLPRLSQSWLICAVMVLLLFAVSARIIKRYNFSFTGTQGGR